MTWSPTILALTYSSKLSLLSTGMGLSSIIYQWLSMLRDIISVYRPRPAVAEHLGH